MISVPKGTAVIVPTGDWILDDVDLCNPALPKAAGEANWRLVWNSNHPLSAHHLPPIISDDD